MITLATTTASSMISGITDNFGGLMTVLIPFVVGILLWTIAKKWFFGGTRRI